MSAWFWDHLKPNHYDLIVADFPWPHEHWGEKATEVARPYDVMTIEEIMAAPVGALATDNTLLLHWIVAPQLDIGIECLKAWGFTYRSFMHWRKVSQWGMPLMGQGKRVRTMGELCLIGTIGEPKHKPFRGDFPGIRREHSRKPESFYDNIDKYCPNLTRRADLFGRQSRPGWDVFGNEATKFDEVVV